MHKLKKLSRRDFIRSTAHAGGALALSSIVPCRLFSQTSALEKINLGCIGLGRMGREDLNDFLRFDEIQVAAVCDVDTKRRREARELVETHYANQTKSGNYKGCQEYEDFRELIAQSEIDAVSIVTPDHWHTLITIEAVKAGKDLFLEKPFTRTIAEGKILRNLVHQYGIVFQLGSQQRSDAKFRFACELVRNGRIGKVHTVRVGLPEDIATAPQKTMAVPQNLNYDLWLGPAPERPYTELRVHPQESYDRPGWMRVNDYAAGMITNWGAHHLDIVQWGLGMEESGPVEIEGQATFPEDGLWDVHLSFQIKYTYANDVKLICACQQENKQGVLFEGDEGWVFVKRGFIDAHPIGLLTSFIHPNEIRLYESNDHKQNFIDCIRTRSLTIAPVDNAHRSNTICLLGEIAMILKRKLYWDPEEEHFINDDEANRLLNKPMRAPWCI